MHKCSVRIAEVCMGNDSALFESGQFFIGCNYWASHAGTRMWSDWRPDIIDSDFARLEENRINVLRIFPLWSDFQPLRIHRSGGGSPREIRIREDVLPFTEAGRAGVDIVMADRFEEFCDLAEKHHIRLVVGLVTGWMSGRLFVPEAFGGLRIQGDPLVLRWTLRYVRYMVKRFASHPAVAAWDLGNECNCMGGSDGRDGAYLWTSALTDAIRTCDTAHPIVSGMHGLQPEGQWTPEDQGELTDILCTHPYPLFTAYCSTDPINEMKSVMHASAESVFYRGLGGKPCFIEEIGTLGPMIASDEIAADYVRNVLLSAYAYDLEGFLWWCANEQSELTHSPYDWDACERELGLFRIDGTKKPVLEAMTAFSEFIEKLPFDRLPERIHEAVCILTHGQDCWAAAYGSFILAAQAGFDLEYAWCEDKIPDSDVYFVPSISGSISRHAIYDILARVKKGATLYMSIGSVLLSPFSEVTGVRVLTRADRARNVRFTLGGDTLSVSAPITLKFESVGAEILASDENGNPVLSEYKYGEGKVIFCGVPVECYAGASAGLFSGDGAVPLYRIYEAVGARSAERTAKVEDCPSVVLTEHPCGDGGRILVIINYTPRPADAFVSLTEGCPDGVYALAGGFAEKTDGGINVSLPGNTGIIVTVK